MLHLLCLLFSIMVISLLTKGRLNGQEEMSLQTRLALHQVSKNDRVLFEVVIKDLFFCQDMSYPLFGVKPMAFTVYWMNWPTDHPFSVLPGDFCIASCKEQIEIIQKYYPLFSSENFLMKFSKIYHGTKGLGYANLYGLYFIHRR